MKRWLLGLLTVVASMTVLATACRATPQVTSTSELPASTAPQATPAAPDQTSKPATDVLDTDEETEDDAAVQPLYQLDGEIDLDVTEINALVTFVEQATGRSFVSPPNIVAQTVADFEAGLALDAEDLAELDETIDVDVRTLQALGFTTDSVGEVRQTLLDAFSSNDVVAGYYDPEVDTLFVPVDAAPDANFKGLLVHELTHALDDQYTDLEQVLDRMDALRDADQSDDAFVLIAIVEGRATAVQDRWHTEAGIAETYDEDLGRAGELPPVVLVDLSLPYAFGGNWIESLGGPSATNNLIQDPPLSSEAVLGGSSEESAPVETPAAAGPVLDVIDVGPAQLVTWVLGDSLDPNPALAIGIVTPMRSFDGGRGVLWGDDQESCVAFTVKMDGQASVDLTADALRLWAEDTTREVTVDGNMVDVVSCAPYVP